jgi:hypothetical protein
MHSRSSLLWVLCLAVLACGDDGVGGAVDAAVETIDAPLADATTGACGATATVNGMVEGVTIVPVRAYELTIPNLGVGIVLDEAATPCGSTPMAGEHLVFGTCQAAPVGDTTIVGEQAFDCPSTNAFGLIEQDRTDFAEATSGTLTITSRTATCVEGTFTVAFSAETLTGSFAEEICP